MQVFTTKAAVRDSVRGWRAEGQSVALVPTMGYLHRGHMALVERAKTQAQRVVTSIFVNPLQFGPGEDLATYPRDADRDLAMLRDAGVDGVFLPSVEEVYPPGAQTIVETTELARMLIGKLRPGHFRGVTTVVTKLFNIVQPDTAVFGEKDYQQLCIIRQMVRDLDMPIHIEGVPTVREEDGLALSSRNVRLTPEDRAASVILSQSLFAAEAMAKTGITASRLRAWVAANIGANPRADLQSADIRDAATLATISGPLQRPAVILLAVRFGKVLLIDQRVVTP
ncbi:pantoate--beta-alanine ligase [Pararhodobacter sp.]|uniref:pantoate--beta-alanine ligase n=1 Tax=Pararhodobacter sp. TaxID=2127056 RepID=UPI002AFFC249|nr:pantoate--beta-alanine ligase [Pararhodobacter sp.]